MVQDDNQKKRRAADDDDESGERGSSGQGGKGGGIEFRDFISLREAQSPEEQKRLLSTHKDINSELIDKQKQLLDQRKEQKEGRTVGRDYGAGAESREASFLKHPILGEAAEFDGIDPQVNLDPTIYNDEINSEKKAELTYQAKPELRQQHQHQPTHRYKPSPF